MPPFTRVMRSNLFVLSPSFRLSLALSLIYSAHFSMLGHRFVVSQSTRSLPSLWMAVLMSGTES